MNNFEFKNPVKLIFGKGQIAKLSEEIARGTKVMMTYGGGSIKRNGVYDQVIDALKKAECEVIEFGGIEANPDYSTLVKAIDICKKKNVEMLLAVGGGSIIDGTKFIALASKYNDGEPWDIITKHIEVDDAIPFGSVLTLPATSSEMNNGGVVSRRETKDKYAFSSPYTFAKFSILDPEVIYSLPKRQIANGITDIFAHTLEQYLTIDNKTMVMDEWAEGILRTLITLAPILTEEKKSYDVCANYMLTGTLGLNGFISMGVVQDWATHMIGHELTAQKGLDHGQTLAIVFPGTMSIMRKEKHDKLLRYADKVWNISTGNGKSEDDVIDEVIEKTDKFFQSVGQKTRLSDYNIDKDTIDIIVAKFKAANWNVGENGIVTPDKVRAILENRL
ncbi:MAG: iron-containing alcohol dehydrogenase [Bacteroidales bacterium]